MTVANLSAGIEQAQAEFTSLNAGRHQQGNWRDLPPGAERRIVELAEEIARLRRFEAWTRVKQLLANKQFMDGMRNLC